MRRLTLALSSLALLVACSGPSDGGCTVDADCGAGQACVDGACAARPDGGGVDASACGASCECLIPEDCPLAAACADTLCEANRCTYVERNERCAPVGICSAFEGCVAPGLDAGPSDAGTDAGASDAGTDAGSPRDAGPPNPVGGACAVATDCPPELGSTRQCVLRTRDGVSFAGGYCSARCLDLGMCPSGSVCWQSGTFFDRYCLESCRDSADCRSREGYVCGTPNVGDLSPPSMVCIPAALAR